MTKLKAKSLDSIKQTHTWWKMQNKTTQIIKKFSYTWIISLYGYKQMVYIIIWTNLSSEIWTDYYKLKS